MPRPSHLFEPFLQPATTHIARRFSWHVLSKQRSYPLITGFSSIRTWVTQPRHQLRRFGNKQIYQVGGEAHSFFRPYKGTRVHLFHPRLLPPCSSILAHSSFSTQVRVFLLQPSLAMSARALYHMDASDTIIYVCQNAQTVPGKR